jgi:cell division septum initiation protein DivIVA
LVLDLEEIVSVQEDLIRERAELRARIQQLEHELARYREHAQRTSKLFLFATDYADSIRQSARRDATLALRKARERAARILGDLENERKQAEDELRRLQALTDETRTRLTAFTTAALHVLNAQVETGLDNASEGALGDLQDVLRTQLTTASDSAETALPTAGTQER